MLARTAPTSIYLFYNDAVLDSCLPTALDYRPFCRLCLTMHTFVDVGYPANGVTHTTGHLPPLICRANDAPRYVCLIGQARFSPRHARPSRAAGPHALHCGRHALHSGHMQPFMVVCALHRRGYFRFIRCHCSTRAYYAWTRTRSPDSPSARVAAILPAMFSHTSSPVTHLFHAG